ncbi:hypothetical protein BDZ91DRAFT_844988 [Kalaharituber pfeilii]|nr:hypothetical protein BDZ91DRAFT_844988 [Kalaharituber pfeilii]
MEAPTSTSEPPGLFNEVVFYTVESDKLSKEEAEKTRKALLENGAREAERITDPDKRIPFDPAEVTHVIAGDVDFPGQLEVEEAMKPIVTPQWVQTSIAKKRIAHVRPYTPDPRLFFSGVNATVVELPVGDKEAICGGILAMGGQYSSSLSKFTTHIVALNMDNEKCKHVMVKKLPIKIVLPHWFDDCLKLNRRIDEQPYLLPNPEIERIDSAQPLPLPRGPDLTYTHANSAAASKAPPSPRPNFKVFMGKRVLLGKDLDINPRLRGVISDIIQQARGEITEDVLDAHVYVGQWREGLDYVTASRRGLDVGSLTWLYWMFAHGKWTNPLKRLLHYPLVKGGIPGMEKAIITVSNYGGDARLYLENLIEAAGAKFTKSMKADNTHLITARAHSEKCAAAKEWNIHMVNHLWLEESYAKWKVLSVTDPKYTHFPTRTNLMEVVGQTQICPRTIQQFYDDEDVDMTSDGEPGHEMVIRTATSVGDGSKEHVTFPEKGRKKAARPDARPLELATPSSRNKSAFDETPSSVTTNGSRRAKEQATARLHDLAPDIALYEKEKKRKGGCLTHKRPMSAGSDHTGDEDEVVSVEGTKNKKPKKKVKPTVKLLVTGYDGWKVPAREDADKRRLLDMGIQCVPEPNLCTHLAAPKIVRTRNFVCAIAYAPIVVSIAWVEACLNEDRIVDTQKYLLADPDGESRFNMSLPQSLSRAAQNKGKLLETHVIYCAPGVAGGFETCNDITRANGGICVNFKSGKRGANTPDEIEGGKLVLLSSEAAGDQKLWKPFVTMAKQLGAEPLIYKTDWLLDSAMKQVLRWDDKYLIPQKK